MRESSRGKLRLHSADPTLPPIIDPNYLSTADDVQDMRACVRIAREVMYNLLCELLASPIGLNCEQTSVN